MNTRIRKHILLIVLATCTQLPVIGQDGNRMQLRSGNRSYEKGDYAIAEGHYRKALGKQPGSVQGGYNLGGALYQQGKFPEARDQYRSLLSGKHDSLTMNSLWYNFGNASVMQYLKSMESGSKEAGEFLEQGIEAYSEALRYDPKDEDARYNLTKALQLRRQQPPKQQQNQSEHEQDKQKREQPMPETKMKEEENEQKAPPPPAGKISREDAERMLNAIREKEKKTAEQINERERRRVTQGKLNDW
ncbi:MAG: tetratricopeptide repeat protein [Bacteroidales bacterium]